MLRVFSEPTTANGILFYGIRIHMWRIESCLDLCIKGAFFVVEFIIVVWIHFDVVESELCFNLGN